MTQGAATDTDPQWDPTYRFSTAAPQAGLDHTHTVSVHLSLPSYPSTHDDRRALVGRVGPLLVEHWLALGLPRGELYHLVHRTAAAEAADGGAVSVAVVLSNIAADPTSVVSRVRVA